MIECNVFPNMKTKCVTFSFVAGHENDIHIVSLLNKYGVKASFYIEDEYIKGKTGEIYKGHDISFLHVNEFDGNLEEIQNYIKESKRYAEEISNYPVLGMALKNASKKIEKAILQCGIKFCCLDTLSGSYKVPEDFIRWSPTCNLKEAVELYGYFVNSYKNSINDPLLHIYGKTSEIKSEEDLRELELILKGLVKDNSIWFATNTEVYEYIMAQRRMITSTDEKSFYNPSNIDIWIKRNHVETFCISAGGKISFRYIE